MSDARREYAKLLAKMEAGGMNGRGKKAAKEYARLFYLRRLLDHEFLPGCNDSWTNDLTALPNQTKPN